MIAYWFFLIFIQLFRWIPFPVLYIISDGLRWILQHVVKYRLSVIHKNLNASFPNVSADIKKQWIKGIYLNLTDIMLESIKGLSMTKDEILKRSLFLNTDFVKTLLASKQSVIATAGHYGNWEWGIFGFGYNFPNQSIGIYKKVNNVRINDYLNKLRSKGSIMLIPTSETRLIKEEIPKGKLIIMMSDQNPSNVKDAIWVHFLNQDTACVHGMEKYALNHQLPIVFVDIQRVKRGYYELTFSPLIEDPSQHKPGEITQIYMSRLETIIRTNPPDWLWTHKRWKHQKKESILQV